MRGCLAPYRHQPRCAEEPDRGSAIVDFVLVSGLVTLLFAGLLQLALALHVRNTLIDCAAEGARYAALADRTAGDGADRTRQLISMSLSDSLAPEVDAGYTSVGGVPVAEVRVGARLPVLGLLGPEGVLMVTGHAVREDP